MTLVLLHGFTGGPASWDPVVARLPGGGRRQGPLLRPFLTGHGPDPVYVPDFDAEVRRLCELVEEHGAPAHLAAYSMGARVGLAMLAARPDLFDRATLIGTRDGLHDASDRADRGAWERRWIGMLEERGLGPFIEAWESLPLWESQESAPAERLDAQRRIRRENTAPGLAHALRVLGLAAMPPLGDRLARVDVDVLLMTGALDPKFGRLAEPLERALPRGRRLTVEHAGHNLLLERPEAVADALNADEIG